jgi:hypothetical protein
MQPAVKIRGPVTDRLLPYNGGPCRHAFEALDGWLTDSDAPAPIGLEDLGHGDTTGCIRV